MVIELQVSDSWVAYGLNKRRSCNWVVSHLQIKTFYAKQTASWYQVLISFEKHKYYQISSGIFFPYLLRERVEPTNLRAQPIFSWCTMHHTVHQIWGQSAASHCASKYFLRYLSLPRKNIQFSTHNVSFCTAIKFSEPCAAWSSKSKPP